MHRIAKTAIAFAAATALAASVALTGCSSTAGNNGSTAANFAEQQGTQIANDIIGIENWNAFAANTGTAVLGGTAESTYDNTCFSPASLYFALALAGEGVQGNAQIQLLELLGVKNAEELTEFCETWIAALQDQTEEDIVALANSVWIGENYVFTPEYLNVVQDELDASAFNVAFGTEEADEQISTWVSNETQGLLQPKFNTSPLDVAKLINTVYFKSGWLEQFDAAANTTDTFHAPLGDVPAEYLHKSLENATYAEGGNFTACQLGFTNGYTMSFFLPDDATEAQDLFVDAAAIQQLLDAEFEMRPVDITLPKFTIDSTFGNLIDALRALGVEDIFDGSDPAMFANMIQTEGGAPDFYISDAIQETHLGLDENGVEAAAYTALGIKAMAMESPEGPISFVLDRPFSYLVQSPDGVVLFMGTMNSPV